MIKPVFGFPSSVSVPADVEARTQIMWTPLNLLVVAILLGDFAVSICKYKCSHIIYCPKLRNINKERLQPCDGGYEYPWVCCPTSEKESLKEKEIPCGTPASLYFITGGTDVPLGRYPWMALIKYNTKGNSKYKCGGSLIHPQYILTAAHCVKRDIVEVRLGENDLSKDRDCITFQNNQKFCSKSQDISIAQSFVHPQFNLTQHEEHDIAILRLRRPAEVNDFVRPICLPSAVDEHELINNRNIIVTGWGYIKWDKMENSLKLQKGKFEHVNWNWCRNEYYNLTRKNIFASQFCLSGKLPSTDSCRGDSGGPAFVTKTRQSHPYIQIGVTSYGPTLCGVSPLPGVYTRIVPYLDWVYTIVPRSPRP